MSNVKEMDQNQTLTPWSVAENFNNCA